MSRRAAAAPVTEAQTPQRTIGWASCFSHDAVVAAASTAATNASALNGTDRKAGSPQRGGNNAGAADKAVTPGPRWGAVFFAPRGKLFMLSPTDVAFECHAVASTAPMPSRATWAPIAIGGRAPTPRRHFGYHDASGAHASAPLFISSGLAFGTSVLEDLWEVKCQANGSLKWAPVSLKGSAPGLAARHSHALALRRGTHTAGGLVMFGGVDADDAPLGDLCRYKAESRGWVRVDVDGEEQPLPRANASLAALEDGGVLLCGGTCGHEPLNDVWYVTLRESTMAPRWQRVECPVAIPRQFGARLHVLKTHGHHKARVCLFGGVDALRLRSLADVYVFDVEVQNDGCRCVVVRAVHARGTAAPTVCAPVAGMPLPPSMPLSVMHGAHHVTADGAALLWYGGSPVANPLGDCSGTLWAAALGPVVATTRSDVPAAPD